MAPRSQAEAENAQIAARYNYQLEKENMPKIYRCVEATKTGGKGLEKEKVLFLKNPNKTNRTGKRFSFEHLQLVLCDINISSSFLRVLHVAWSRLAGSGPVKLLISQPEICLKFAFSHFL